MKKHILTSKLVLSLILVIITIGSYAQVKGNGHVVSQERNVDNFTAIKLSSSADIYITQGEQSVVVKTDENILELIETKVDGGTLTISVKGRGFRSVEGLDVIISVPNLDNISNSGSGDIEFGGVFKAKDLLIRINGSGDLDGEFDATNLELKISGSGDSDISGIMGLFKVTVSGSGDVVAEGLKLEECFIKNSGSGDLRLKGKTNDLTVSQNGSGDLNAYNFTAVNATISNSGSSDMSLNVVEKLQVTLNGSGDLTYRGDPQKVDVRSNGSGDVYRR